MMKKERNGNRDQGCLYVVATPIGNLEDITLRALNVLKSANMIVAENTRRTRILCNHFGIKTKIVSFNQHNQKRKGPELIRQLQSGRTVAMVTDAGTPCISDPGSSFIHLALLKDIKVIPIPGPSAIIAALSVSGLPSEQFLFSGFLPTTSGKRKKALKSLFYEPRTLVFFEAPHRLLNSLADLYEILGDRQMVVVREMTKFFEEIKSGPIQMLIKELEKEKIRGEFTLVVSGCNHREKGVLRPEVIENIDVLLAEKQVSIKDISIKISKEEGLTYRQVYRECLERKKTMTDSEPHESGKKITN